ncbi:MAG: molybdopterin molybdotransferase MoeA [Planctomycetaceae bacterium]
MHSVADAFDDILSHVQRAEPVVLPLSETLELVLAENLTTPHDSPPFDKSMMDGFAVASAGFRHSGSRTLPVSETITAGTVPRHHVTPDTAVRIMTGAPLPEGADCVIPIEDVQWNPELPNEVTMAADSIAAERNVLRQGSSAKTGSSLMSTGTMLQPQHIAVLAEFGIASVPVFRRPTVAVLATGDELVDVAEPLSPGFIRNSNEPMLVAQIRRASATPVPLGVARDCRRLLRPYRSRLAARLPAAVGERVGRGSGSGPF